VGALQFATSSVNHQANIVFMIQVHLQVGLAQFVGIHSVSDEIGRVIAGIAPLGVI
jgi:hypothetical protein